MKARLAWPVCVLSLLLTACSGEDPATLPAAGVCPQARPGGVQAQAGGLAPLDFEAVAGLKPDWSAPHVPGQVLLLGAGGLSAQGTGAPGNGSRDAQVLGPLAGVQTRAVVPGVTLALTPTRETDEAFARRLGAAGLTAQPNFVYRALGTPNDPGYPGNGGVRVGTVSASQHYLTRVAAPAAWDFLAGCGKALSGAPTAVLDTGVDAAHPDLTGRLLPPVTAVARGTATGDATGHGTASVGLIGAATNNGLGVAGMVPVGRHVLSVRVLDEDGGTTADLAAGLRRAVSSGAQVINMSLGQPGEPNDAVLTAALTSAAASAVLVVAAGNTASQGVYFPASHPDVIAVGAVGVTDGVLACYSARPSAQRPRRLDLVAPGGAGAGVCPGATPAQDLLVLAPEGGYTLRAGTSEAAPLVSGAAALMRAANPTLSAAAARERLLASARVVAGLPHLDLEAAVRAATR